MRLLPGDVISDSIAFTGAYELQLTRLVWKLAKQGGQMVDVGANLGYFSLLWAAANPMNTAIAFEPSPRNVELLRRNVAENGLKDRVEIRALAAGDEDGDRYFDVGPIEQTGWGKIVSSPTERSTSVTMVRLDSIIAEAEQVEFLKIDVEGHDTYVLEGAKRLLAQQRIKHIAWEQNKPLMRSSGIRLDEANHLLARFGYEATPQNNPGDECVQWYAGYR